MIEQYFPFRKLGLSCNPFRALTRPELTEVAIVPPQIKSLLAKGFTHLQILGDQGRGKTTTLLALQADCSQQEIRTSYEYLHAGQRAFQTHLDQLDLFLLDEFQRLGTRQRARLLERIAQTPLDGLQLFFASHEDMTHLFQAHGRPLATYLLGQIDTIFLGSLIERRLQTFALGDQSRIKFSAEAIEALLEWFGPDMRAMEAFLYDVFQTLQDAGEITSEVLLAYRLQFTAGAARG